MTHILRATSVPLESTLKSAQLSKRARQLNSKFGIQLGKNVLGQSRAATIEELMVSLLFMMLPTKRALTM
uniref:GTP-binding family protein n=1 Tax=Rhizophora mucronata TaxID=61149 RepID=A0A2P2KPG5_RHIMU